MITIKIHYKMAQSQLWSEMDVSPTDFFDLDPGECPSVDSIPKKNHAAEYLDVSTEFLEATVLRVASDEKNVSLTVSEFYWNQGRNRLIERVDGGTNTEYREMILISHLQDEPEKMEIVRIGDTGGRLRLWSHVILTKNNDGSESEEKYFPADSQVKRDIVDSD
jgi:hypothetical protein